MELNHLVLVMDIAKNIEGLRRNMRENAENYKLQVLTEDVDNIRELILADNFQYQRRLGWIKNLYDNHQTTMEIALAGLNITINDTIQTYQELKNVADITDVADLSDVTKITAHADYILTNIQPHLTVW